MKKEDGFRGIPNTGKTATKARKRELPCDI
jgi:hypothetical protein